VGREEMKEGMQGRGSRRLTRQISCECVHCVGFLWPKTTIVGKLWLLGSPVPAPFTDEGQIWCPIADPQCTFMCQNSPRSVYSVALWRRKTQFVPYFGFRHLLMSTVGLNLRKLNTGAQLKIFPYLTASKSFLYSQRLYGEIGRTNSDVQKRDGQTKKSTFIANPAADEIHAPPNLARW